MALSGQPGPSGPKPRGATLWVALAAAAVASAAIAIVWLRSTDEPVADIDPALAARAQPARDAGIGRPPLPAPVATQPATAQDVRPPDAVAQPFPQIHAKPRRVRKEGERAATRRAKQELFESEESALYDTAEPFEVPFEGDFPDRGTFSFWLNPVWDPTSQDDASFVTVADGRLRIVKNVSFLRFETVDAIGNGDGIGVPITDWQPGDWRFVTATWDEGVIALYVDGALVGQKFIPALELPADSSVTVGSLFPPGRPVAPGLIGGFRFRGRPLNPGTIGREFERTMPAPIGEEAP
jgi:hypothetical protein